MNGEVHVCRCIILSLKLNTVRVLLFEGFVFLLNFSYKSQKVNQSYLVKTDKCLNYEINTPNFFQILGSMSFNKNLHLEIKLPYGSIVCTHIFIQAETRVLCKLYIDSVTHPNWHYLKVTFINGYKI